LTATSTDVVQVSSVTSTSSAICSTIDGNRLRFDGDVNRSRDFAVTLRFRDSDRGQYTMAAYLFWPNSGTQFPRTTLSTFTVE
jgi:hypothetical protein